jgi:hypothetical protein
LNAGGKAWFSACLLKPPSKAGWRWYEKKGERLQMFNIVLFDTAFGHPVPGLERRRETMLFRLLTKAAVQGGVVLI